MAGYVGNAHFDWSYINHYYPNDNVLTILRDPVERAVSHFEFMKRLPWTSKMAIRHQSIGQFLLDPESMMANRGCWQDGQAAVSWLSGTHVGYGWVKGPPIRPSKNEMEAAMIDYRKILLIAAERLENMFWFGLLEDLDRSLEMLQYQLGLSKKVKKFIQCHL